MQSSRSLLLLAPLGLLALQQLAPVTASPLETIFSSVSSSSGVTLLRANKFRRPELCRENLPRKSEELPALVITARVKEVYLAGEQPAGATKEPAANKALVSVGRVIRGDQRLAASDIIISGFNSTSAQPCPNYVKPNDTLILFLNQEGERTFSIQAGNMLRMNLSNLDRVNAVAADEPYKRRAPIEDILCEAHYCAYGRCKLNERTNETACHCPDFCPPDQAPVCGSDNATYSNECLLIKEGCRQQRPLFVTREAACQ